MKRNRSMLSCVTLTDLGHFKRAVVITLHINGVITELEQILGQCAILIHKSLFIFFCLWT